LRSQTKRDSPPFDSTERKKEKSLIVFAEGGAEYGACDALETIDPFFSRSESGGGGKRERGENTATDDS
jgi:hypothetical protein